MPRKIPYAERLKDPRWQRKRLEIMQRDDFACRECFSTTKTLNVHHRFYLRGLAPWEYKPDWLETLCENCHEGREKAIELLHKSLLDCSTGELLGWSKRIHKEREEPKRRMQAAAPKEAVPAYVPSDGDQTAWEALSESDKKERGRLAFQRMREALMET